MGNSCLSTGSLSMNEPKQVVVSPQYWIGSRKKESTLGQDDEVVVELYPHEMPLVCVSLSIYS